MKSERATQVFLLAAGLVFFLVGILRAAKMQVNRMAAAEAAEAQPEEGAEPSGEASEQEDEASEESEESIGPDESKEWSFMKETMETLKCKAVHVAGSAAQT